MEILSRLRWLIIIFFLLVFLIIVGWGLSTIARNIFAPRAADTQLNSEALALVEGVNVARLTVSGPVVASSEHRSYTIEVNENVVVLTLYSDYGQTELEQKSYRNNPESFGVFKKSLESLDVTSRIRGTDTEDDLNFEGQCPDGRRYIVALDTSLQRWSTTCQNTTGTMSSLRMSEIRRLFNRQAPDGQDILQGTNLYVN